jgi:hypothetical protein
LRIRSNRNVPAREDFTGMRRDGSAKVGNIRIMPVGISGLQPGPHARFDSFFETRPAPRGPS